MKRSLKAYLIYTAVILVLCIAAVVYIHGLLVRYEASQPERKVEEHIAAIKKAAEEGNVESVISFEEFKAESDDVYNKEIQRLEAKLKSEEITYADRYSATGRSYDIKCGIETVCRVDLSSIESERETKLIVFNFEKWEVTSTKAAVISGEIEMSSSLTLTIQGEKVEGKPSNTKGFTVYDFQRVTTPEIIVSDLAGDTTVYDPSKKIMTYGYKVMIPSTYKLTANGKEIDSDSALRAETDDFRDIEAYCDTVPADLTYDMVFLSNDVKFEITDQTGKKLDYEMKNRCIELELQPTGAAVPEDIAAQIDVLDAAHKWSLFMTNDLIGQTNGYYKMEEYLIKDSYLAEKAYKWATGIDITFTSIHTLDNPAFKNEVVTDYVRYSDKCFSCLIKFEKPMHLNSGKTVVDSMNSTFYFVNVAEKGKEPDWKILSIRANVVNGGEKGE